MTQLRTLCMVSLLLYLYDKRHDYIYWTSVLVEWQRAKALEFGSQWKKSLIFFKRVSQIPRDHPAPLRCKRIIANDTACLEHDRRSQ